VFWFVAEPGAEPKPSRMAGYFSEIPSNLDLLPDRYFNLPLYKDEIWPNVQGAFDFVGFRDEAYFPSGYVSWRPDGSASYLIDPALNTKAFLDVISAQTGTSLAQAKVTLKETRAPGRIGVPIAEDYDAHIGFGRSATERPKPELGPLIEDRAYGAMLGLAVGDALGVPLEFSERDSLPHVSEMIGGGPFGLKPGEWTDDTSMALCLADSLIAKSTLDEIDLLNRLVRWWSKVRTASTAAALTSGSPRGKPLIALSGSGPRSGAVPTTRTTRGTAR
jgi:hypothetical protein